MVEFWYRWENVDYKHCLHRYHAIQWRTGVGGGGGASESGVTSLYLGQSLVGSTDEAPPPPLG